MIMKTETAQHNPN